MEDWVFNQQDMQLMAALGISENQVRDQMTLLQEPSGYLRLLRPCVPGDGIKRIPADELESLIFLQEEATREGRFIKFIPASGAATRMFQGLLPFYLQRASLGAEENHSNLLEKDPGKAELKNFFPTFSDLLSGRN